LKIKLYFILFILHAISSLGQVAKFDTSKNIQLDSTSLELKKFDSNFKTKYKTADFEYEPKPIQKNAWERFKDYLAAKLKSKFNYSNSDKSAYYINLFFKIILIIIIALAVFLIIKAILGREGSLIFGKSSSKKIIKYDTIEKNLHEIEFSKIIDEAIKADDKRSAVRYYYLWLLKKMSDKEIILWNIEKTNSDYLHEIKDPNFKNTFRQLSYLYNYIWYGEFEIDQTAFDKTIKSFNQTLNTLKHE
jgi:hypothetical protein